MDNISNNKNLTEKDVKKIVEDRISSYLKLVKYFLYGLTGFFIIGFASGLILPKNLLRVIHDGLFGNEKIVINKIETSLQSEVGVSYHRSFTLHSPDQRQERMLFFAEDDQRVKVYLETSHYGKSLEKRRLIVQIDKQILWDKVEDIKGGFKDITPKIFSENKPTTDREENVHALEFSLDDTQLIDLEDMVFVDCVILVFGKLSDVKN